MTTMRNRILREFARSSPDEFAKFSEVLEPTVLERGAVLGTARSKTESVYFVDSGIVSLVATTKAGHSLDVALIGNEGVTGVADALGQHALPYAWVVQLPGHAHRAPTAMLREHILSCTDLHSLLMAYSQLVVHQLAQSAVCNRFHSSLQRLSRWLLLTADRAGTDQLQLTHELMAQMLGAPRSAVTQAATSLRRDGIIEYHRGLVTILSTARLQAAACECVGTISRVIDAGDPGPVRQ